ncbi:MAG TPA: hypothetical protein VIO38_09275, partial [Rariglobus sp.]
MNMLRLPRILCALVSAALVPLASAKVVFSHGFESYPASAAISGQTAGATTWSAQGVIVGDLAVISTAHASEGAQSLLLADNGANRPRASLNLVNTGYVSAALSVGSVSLALREDPDDAGTGDAFTLNVGNIALSRGASSTFYFSVTGGGGQTVNFGAHYTPGAWNNIRIDF